MEEAESRWELGIGSVPDTFVCAKHISEPAITRVIKSKAEPGFCDYCERRKKVVPLLVAVEYVMEVVRTYYTDPANFMSYETAEGGYLGNVYTAEELLQEHLELDVDDALFNDFYEGIDLVKQWADEWEYYDTPADTLIYSWDYFTRLLKHRSRYFFNSVKDLASHDYRLLPEETLDEVGASVKKYNLIREIPAGTIMYRCRQHTLEDTTVDTFSGMTSPPDERATQPNRMSPAGVSMFYAAFDERTAVQETVDENNASLPFYTVAEFELKGEITVVDLTTVPNIPSIFDLKKKRSYYQLIFLNRFVNDLVKPIERDDKVHINYVPTQVVTEYLRYPFSDKLRSKRIDGLIYKSSKTGRRACVLFFNNEESIDKLQSDPTSYRRSAITV